MAEKTKGDIDMRTCTKNENRPDKKTFAKTAFLAFTVSLLVFFSYAASLRAHDYTDIPVREGRANNHSADSITAKDVTAGDMEEMREFVLHARAHMKQLVDYPRGLAPFLQKIEQEGGDWRKDGIYILRISGEGTIQPPHPRYPLAQGGTLNEYSPMRELRGELGNTQKGSAACVDYAFEGEDRAACIVSSDLDYQTPPFPAILVAGLDHNFSDLVFSGLECPHYVPETSAADVSDRDTLKKFVDEVAHFYVDLVGRIGTSRFINSLSCFRVLPWKNDSVYLFAMIDDTQLVVFNGNTPGLENRTLNVVDANGTNVGDLIVNALRDKPSHEGAFVEYLWDDPTDDVPAIAEEGRAPGDVPKLSYVVGAPLGDSGRRVIWGSGIYNETDDDSGCAIAGAEGASGGAALNFFMIVLMLLPAVFWKKRFGAKRIFARSETAAFLVFALVAVAFLSGTPTASAHQGSHSQSVTAGDVDPSDQDGMSEFALHAKAHWEAIDDPNENIRFEKSLTVGGGDWKNDTVYLMVIDKDGTIYTHAHDPEQQNGTLLHSSEDQPEPMLLPKVRELVLSAEEGGCITYVSEADEDPEEHASEGHDDHEQRAACSVKFTHPVWRTELILIAGYHHDHEEHDYTNLSFDNVTCPYFVSEIIDEEPYFKQGVTANKVKDSDTLKSFVGEFKKHLREQVEGTDNPAKLATIRNCWRALPWKYGGVYLFVMTEEDQLVFFNGNSPALENGTLSVEDDNGCNVGSEVVRVANGEQRQCRDLGLLPENSQGFVEYLWDDPTDSTPALSEEGAAPGDVPKLSYVEKVTFDGFLGGQALIIGSGYHPEVSDDDGGCAVAATSAEARGALFSLLAVVAVMFSAAFLRSRFEEE